MLHEVRIWELIFDDVGNIKTWKLVDANPAALKSWNKDLSEIVGKICAGKVAVRRGTHIVCGG
jgi:hypothetical protein